MQCTLQTQLEENFPNPFLQLVPSTTILKNTYLPLKSALGVHIALITVYIGKHSVWKIRVYESLKMMEQRTPGIQPSQKATNELEKKKKKLSESALEKLQNPVKNLQQKGLTTPKIWWRKKVLLCGKRLLWCFKSFTYHPPHLKSAAAVRRVAGTTGASCWCQREQYGPYS